jgi:hypothetical protein
LADNLQLVMSAAMAPATKRLRAMVSRLALCLALSAAGCLGALDTLGYEDRVTNTQDSLGTSQIEDDRIEDKHPASDPTRTVVESFGSWCQVTMNKSATVTKLDIAPFDGSEAALEDKLFRGRKQALDAVATVEGADAVPSMEVVNGYLKPFNDGLYAAVELAAEDAKRPLVRTLLARVNTLLATATAAERPAVEDAAVLLATALILGGVTPVLDASLEARARADAAAFTADGIYARPIGFYTWSAELEQIFTRDRFLQNRADETPFGAFATLALVLGQDPALLADYQAVTAIYAGLTNPYDSYALDALVPYVPDAAALANPAAIRTAFASTHPPLKFCLGTLVAFLPTSRSKDTEYFDKQFCFGGPGDTNLLGVLIDAIKSGALDLAPGTDAGWYDYQLYALETLLLPDRGPESQHLLLTAGYKKKLVETFKSILIQNRETHVKQLSFGAGTVGGSAEPVDIYPLFPVEPFPTFYLRTARGYRFLKTFLAAALGPDALTATRVLEDGGRGTASLAAELDQRIELLYGLHALSADAVGMARDEGILAGELVEVNAPAATDAARAWLAGWRSDADVVRDPRVIVPVFKDDVTQLTTYWAVIGVKAVKARAEFVPGHEPEVVPTPCWTGNFVRHDYTFLVEETAEVRLPAASPPPTRSELRALCDAHATKAAIVTALEAR